VLALVTGASPLHRRGQPLRVHRRLCTPPTGEYSLPELQRDGGLTRPGARGLAKSPPWARSSEMDSSVAVRPNGYPTRDPTGADGSLDPLRPTRVPSRC
jgi:hypothetical protein